MMEYKGPRQAKTESEQSGSDKFSKEQSSTSTENDFRSKGKDPAPELLDRLAFGKKANVNKEDMYKLTTKNFDQLPEIKKKKDDEKKKEEVKARKEKMKQLDQVIYLCHYYYIKNYPNLHRN